MTYDRPGHCSLRNVTRSVIPSIILYIGLHQIRSLYYNLKAATILLTRVSLVIIILQLQRHYKKSWVLALGAQQPNQSKTKAYSSSYLPIVERERASEGCKQAWRVVAARGRRWPWRRRCCFFCSWWRLRRPLSWPPAHCRSSRRVRVPPRPYSQAPWRGNYLPIRWE